MFLELYEKIKQYLIENNITKASEIKSYCDEKVKELFKELFPTYLNKFNEMNALLNECAHNIAGKYNVETTKAYDMLTKELDMLVPSWQSYFDLNNLAIAVSDSFIDKYYQSKYEDKDFGKGVTSINEAIINTINRNVESGYEMNNKNDLEDLLRWILSEYFDKKNITHFTTRNNSRAYVVSKGKANILKEMMELTNMQSNVPVHELEDVIRASYIKMFVSTSSLNEEFGKEKENAK